jgi:hypothetical protein
LAIWLAALMAPPLAMAEPDDHPFGPGRLTWLLTAKALDLLRSTPKGTDLAERYFDDPKTYIVATPQQLDGLPPRAMPTMGFSSYAKMAAFFQNDHPDPRYRAVLYDCEAWEFTPIEEQKAAGDFHRKAAELVHAQGLTFIAAPATTLRKVVLPPIRENVWPGFLATKIIPDAAAEADIFAVQAQGIAGDIQRYIDLVAGGAGQAKRYNPAVTVLGGLSTRPSGRDLTAEQLVTAVRRTRNIVKGYWLNIPAGGPYCADCGEPRPEIAVDLLDELDKIRRP